MTTDARAEALRRYPLQQRQQTYRAHEARAIFEAGARYIEDTRVKALEAALREVSRMFPETYRLVDRALAESPQGGDDASG